MENESRRKHLFTISEQIDARVYRMTTKCWQDAIGMETMKIDIIRTILQRKLLQSTLFEDDEEKMNDSSL